MRAMVLERPGDALIARTLADPTPRAGEVVLEVEACAVCRTDLHIIDGELTDAALPLIPGHEIVGRVAALAEGVTRFALGQRVGVPWLGHACGQCRYCRAGRENLCPAARFTGYHLQGGYAELARAHADFCLAIPPRYDAIAAAPLLCAGLIGYRTLMMAGDNARRVGIYGFGAAAHIVAQVALHQGRQLWVFTRPGDAAAQSFARSLGATWVGGSDESPEVELDAALIFAPVGELVLARVRKLRDDFVAGALGAIRNLDEPLISARARLLGPNEIAVDDRRIRARSIVIATGSAPIVPQPWQSQFAEHLLSTDTLFEQHDLPACMAVVGAGAIGLELAQALARLGIEIHVFDQATQLPGITDAVVHDSLLRRLRSEFSLHLGAAAELSRTPQGLLEVTNGSARVQVERVLIAIGRRPNLAGLGLEALGITLDERGMPQLDPRSLQVGELPVFLCGDANGERPLLHEAADEGHIAGINAAEIAAAEAGDLPEAGRSKIHHFRRRTPLAIIFTAPNFARIGQDLESDLATCGPLGVEALD